jgi:hypothetical protein
MLLLCPNCQKQLTVPDEFAGQLMKCPLCSGTFTVPGLPGAAPPPSAPDPEVFSIRHDPAPPPPPAAPPQTQMPDFDISPPSTATTTSKPPAPSPGPSLSPLPPEGYQRTLTLWFSPKVLPWIAPVCLLLVFVLFSFNWVGLYPGGVPAVTQNAWQIAFGGGYTEDPDLKQEAVHEEKDKPGWSVLALFYVLLFFPVLAVTVASVVIGMVPLKLPPVVVEKILPWRWGIVAAVNLILFLFLGLQTLLGFSIDSHYTEWVDKRIKRDTPQGPNTQQKKEAERDRGKFMEVLSHTLWLRFVLLLHLVAIVCAALMFWINQRGTHRPLPKVELLW